MQRPAHLPRTFQFSIGGYSGGSHTVKLRRGRLVCSHQRELWEQPTETVLNPSQIQWEQFWDKMGQVGVWEWQREYMNEGVCDGTQWRLELQHGNRRIKSWGSNAYPGSDGPNYSEDSAFALFLRGLQELTGLKGME